MSVYVHRVASRRSLAMSALLLSTSCEPALCFDSAWSAALTCTPRTSPSPTAQNSSSAASAVAACQIRLMAWLPGGAGESLGSGSGSGVGCVPPRTAAASAALLLLRNPAARVRGRHGIPRWPPSMREMLRVSSAGNAAADVVRTSTALASAWRAIKAPARSMYPRLVGAARPQVC